ncbi:hypothetical protein HDU93_004134 [Gonapodya sp. JEL0774]|nr:hypothetical protein HDU93_004134 [Gonapodya sp. JEL0774]
MSDNSNSKKKFIRGAAWVTGMTVGAFVPGPVGRIVEGAINTTASVATSSKSGTAAGSAQVVGGILDATVGGMAGSLVVNGTDLALLAAKSKKSDF